MGLGQPPSMESTCLTAGAKQAVRALFSPNGMSVVVVASRTFLVQGHGHLPSMTRHNAQPAVPCVPGNPVCTSAQTLKSAIPQARVLYRGQVPAQGGPPLPLRALRQPAAAQVRCCGAGRPRSGHAKPPACVPACRMEFSLYACWRAHSMSFLPSPADKLGQPFLALPTA